MRNLVAILLIYLLGISISGCEKQQHEGSAERAGKKIDQTVNKAEVKAQETANAVKGTARAAADTTGKAIERTGEAIQKTGEAIQQKPAQ